MVLEEFETNCGNGKSVRFWDGLWLDDRSFRSKYPRLFNLCCEKKGMVAQMGQWKKGVWCWVFGWRRVLFDREQQVFGKLVEELNTVRLAEGVEDSWRWNGDKTGRFSVKKAYEVIEDAKGETNQFRGNGKQFRRLWKASAPHKALVMAWRLLWNRLPTCDNLAKRIDLPLGERGCKCCRLFHENAKHFFFECNQVVQLWNEFVAWIGASWAAPELMDNHFLSFSNLLYGKKTRMWLGGLWVCIVWVVWKWRNKVVFEKSSWDFKRIEEEIKCRFWSWLPRKGDSQRLISFHGWASTKLSVQWVDI